jgi:ABC-2 type transport system ATP-binding protein
MQSKQPILEVRNLRKVYKNIVAVNNFSLSFPEGLCMGLLGPNGAGKTTAIEIIEDIIEPTAGEILYQGKPRTQSFREEVGIQFQHTSLLSHLTVKETLRTFANLFSDPEDLDSLIEKCQLKPILKSMNNKLSGGQQQRLLLALALINKPNLIFLDEPSTGLDPQARRNLWAIVDEIKDEGKTVILTTHSMEEAQYLCDRVAIMDQGDIIAEGSPEELIETHCGNSSIFLPVDFDTHILEALPNSWSHEHNRIRIDCDDIHEVVGQLTNLGANLSGMSIGAANLEDVFLRLTGRQLRE